MLLVLLACSDYKLAGEDSPVFDDGDDTGLLDTDTTDTGTFVPEEVCNGVDDDGDGAVDEDFSDVDVDGVADCVDDTCAVDLIAAGAVAPSDTCSGTTTVTDPWDTVATNVWTELSTDSDVTSIAQTPLVVQLTDDNGDGVVDDDDTLDVAFIAFENAAPSDQAHIVVLDSATWAEELDISRVYSAAELATGDVDGDGSPDLLTFDGTNRLHAYAMDGSELWSTTPLTNYIGGMPSVAVVDLDGDGVAEVLAQEAILDGATGALLGTLPSRPFSFTQHLTADLDLDGAAEILYDGDVHDVAGALLWEGLAPGSGAMTHALVLDVDGDAEGEVVMAADNVLKIYDTDGTTLVSSGFGGGAASPPCAGDFDGDGAVEVAIPANDALHVFELDGTEMATLPILDTSTMAGCVGADLDGDGALEILYADESTFYIFDARTETAVVSYSEHSSGTLIETPALADLDGNGTMEVLLGSNDNYGRDVWIGLTVIEHAGAGWAAGPSSWPANARVDGRFDASGAVIDVGTWWTRENTFRAVPSTAPLLVRDARVAIDDLCVASCEDGGAMFVAVQVSNPGVDVLPGDTEVVLYRVDGGVRTELSRQAVGVELEPGTSADSLTFAVLASDLGADGLVVTVGEGVEDCHPEDNEDTWTDGSSCP